MADTDQIVSEAELKALLDKAVTLAEALPFIQSFHGETVVIKYGGHAMEDSELKRHIVEDVVLLRLIGMKPVVVHGGGPHISAMMDRLGLKPTFVDGLRVTDAETMDVAEMVLAKVRGEIVSQINAAGARAVGLSGKDGRLFQCRKMLKKSAAGEDLYDLGFVGAITRVDPELIRVVDSRGFIPVVSPIGADEQGQSYNVNADFAAAELAGALQARKFVLLTDVRGVLRDPKNPATLIPSIDAGAVREMTAQGVIAGGMIPKTDACLRALECGVRKAHILDGRLPHALLLELLTQKGVGTEIVGKSE